MMMIMKLQIKLLPNLVGQPEYGLHQSGTVILFWRSCYLTMTNLRTMKKRWWARIPTNGYKPWNPRWDPCMRTNYGLWWACPMNGEPLRINGSLRRRQTLMVMSPFVKLDLSQRSFRQVQGVDCDETLSIIAMLKSVRIMLAVAEFSFTKSGRWMSKQKFPWRFPWGKVVCDTTRRFCRS